MHRLILWQVFISVVFLFFPTTSFASDIVINEIFANPENEDDEFVELYNNSDSEIDLSGWIISDLVKNYTITDTKISPKGFLVLEKSLTGIALNNSNEKVTLIELNGNQIDTFSYESTIENTSLSRSPDGIGDFYSGTNVTKGTNNASAPTSTPAPTTKPTKTPLPTKEPTSTKTPAPTKLNNPEISSDLKEKDNSDNKVVLQPSSEKDNFVASNLETEVRGERDDTQIENQVSKKDERPFYLYSITTGVGMLLLGCAILLYRRFKEKREEDDF